MTLVVVLHRVTSDPTKVQDHVSVGSGGAKSACWEALTIDLRTGLAAFFDSRRGGNGHGDD